MISTCLCALWAATLVCLCACVLASSARAQTPEQFYAGRTVNLIVPFTAGGYYDTGARLMARHLGRHIPGKPGIVVQNQPGGGGLGLANRFGAGADKDGALIAVLQRGLPQLTLMGDPNARYDPLKLTWLGSLSGYRTDAYLLFVNASHPAKYATDLRKPDVKAVLGANQSGSTNYMLAVVAKEVLHLNLDIVRGFPGANDITLAQLRGEVDGQLADHSVMTAGLGDLWRTGKVTTLVQFARTTRLPELPAVPLARELVLDPSDTALIDFAELPFYTALPLAAPAGVPADRAAALKAAFVAMGNDPAFHQDAKVMNTVVDPVDGDTVLGLIAKAAQTPKHVVARYKALVSAN